MFPRAGLSFLSGVCLFLIFSCGGNSAFQADIITQKKASPGKTPLTVLVKNAFSINQFERKVEELFPQIDLIQVGNFVREMGIVEYEARLEHGDLPDMVMTWPLDVGEPFWESRLLDLSGMNFTSRYNLSMLNDISRKGKLYYLPGPAQVRGIVYNKTLFAENGWKVPADFEGFINLCAEIEKTGIRALQLGFANGEVLDTAFVGYNYASHFSKPQDIQWLSDYNNGKGSFGDHFYSALNVFERMIAEGIWKPEDLFVDYSRREKMLFTRQCAMVEDSVLMARMGFGRTGTTDEFALMPFFNPVEDSDWARIYMVCYIGVNKQLGSRENKKKYDLVMDLLDYISTPEGQEALAADTGAMFSSLAGVPAPDIPEIQDLLPALNHGRYALFPQFKNAGNALRSGLANMIRGKVTKEELAAAVDAENLDPPPIAQPEKLGTAAADFSLIDTGSFVADSIRSWSGCEIALYLDNGKDGQTNGKGISARLYSGDITTIDLDRILPDLRYGDIGTLWKAQITGENLLKTLEYSVPVDNNRQGWFYYFSGLRMEYDPIALPGTRIRAITTAAGEKIKADKLYSIAAADNTVPREFLQSLEKTGVPIRTIVSDAVQKAGTVSPPKDGRFIIGKN